MLAQTQASVLRRFFKSDRPPRRRIGVSLLAFFTPMTSKKAAKGFWYQNLLDAFSFEEKGPKEKALQKENAILSLKPLGSRF